MSCMCNESSLTLNFNGSPNIVEDEHGCEHCALRMDLDNGLAASQHLRVCGNGLRVTAAREKQQTALRALGRDSSASLAKWTCKNSARRARSPFGAFC